jgi:hypothetical protein
VTSTQQPRRRPQGTPAGGQFAPAPHHPTPGRDALAGAARVRGVTSAFAAAKADEAGRAQDSSLGEAEARLRSATSATLRAATLDETVARRRAVPVIGRFLARPAAREATTVREAATEAARVAAEATEGAAIHGERESRMRAGVEAEQAVVDALAATPGVSEVVCGMNFGPGVGDVDVLAIGSGVVAVEVKAGRGALAVGDDGTVTHGGRPSPGRPLEQCAAGLRALSERAGLDCLGVVCYPHADTSAVLHAPSGCWLVGGVANLSELASRHLRGAGQVDIDVAIAKVQEGLGGRLGEVTGWIAQAEASNEAAEERVERWQAKIDASWNWSKGPEIRENLGRMVAENQERIAQRSEKISSWDGYAAKITGAIDANNRILGG